MDLPRTVRLQENGEGAFTSGTTATVQSFHEQKSVVVLRDEDCKRCGSSLRWKRGEVAGLELEGWRLEWEGVDYGGGIAEMEVDSGRIWERLTPGSLTHLSLSLRL